MGGGKISTMLIKFLFGMFFIFQLADVSFGQTYEEPQCTILNTRVGEQIGVGPPSVWITQVTVPRCGPVPTCYMGYRCLYVETGEHFDGHAQCNANADGITCPPLSACMAEIRESPSRRADIRFTPPVSPQSTANDSARSAQ